MTEPTNHTLTITLPDGKTVHATVTYLQSKAERATSGTRERTVRVHITCGEWIAPVGIPPLILPAAK